LHGLSNAGAGRHSRAARILGCSQPSPAAKRRIRTPKFTLEVPGNYTLHRQTTRFHPCWMKRLIRLVSSNTPRLAGVIPISLAVLLGRIFAQCGKTHGTGRMILNHCSSELYTMAGWEGWMAICSPKAMSSVPPAGTKAILPRGGEQPADVEPAQLGQASAAGVYLRGCPGAKMASRQPSTGRCSTAFAAATGHPKLPPLRCMPRVPLSTLWTTHFPGPVVVGWANEGGLG
jgi:hypothetical protein